MKRKMLCAVLLIALALSMVPGALAARASIRFPLKVGLMVEGQSVALKPTLKGLSLEQVGWESSDETVCLMLGNTLRALKPGKSVITAAAGSAKARCGVVVLPEKLALAPGESLSLPRGGVERYTIRDAAVASVSKKGVVTARQAGETWLRVRYGRQKVYLPVTVSEPAPAVAQSEVAGMEGLGDAEQAADVLGRREDGRGLRKKRRDGREEKRESGGEKTPGSCLGACFHVVPSCCSEGGRPATGR